MKLFFIVMGCNFSLHAMYDERIDKCIENAKKDPVFIAELQAPVFLDEKFVEYRFIVHKHEDVRTEQLDVDFYRYKNKLVRTITLEKTIEHIPKIKEKHRNNILYQKISLLCIILGHISGMW